MRPYAATYTLHNGVQQTIELLATDGCHAVVQMLDLFGLRLRRISVRPA